MAKKVKFALEMADGEQVRNIDALKEHFDIDKIVGYYHDGRLLTWLKDRRYDEEADKVAELSKSDPQLHNKLCAIFGVELKVEELDVEEIARRTERLNKLKQYTYDRDVLERVDQVAFDQEDLSDLLDEDMALIYLCNNNFVIPLRETDKIYVGIGRAIAVIRSDKVVDFDELHITFRNIKFDDDYEALLKNKASAEQKRREEEEKAKLSEKIFNEGEAAYDVKDYKTALEKYKKAAELGYAKAFSAMGLMYQSGFGVTKSISEAENLIKLGMEKGDANSFGFYGLMILKNNSNLTKEDEEKAFSLIKKATEMGCSDNYYWYILGKMYDKGRGVGKDERRAFALYKKAADAGVVDAINMIGIMYHNVKRDYAAAFKCYQKAAEKGHVWGMYNLAHMYREGEGTSQNITEAIKWYDKAVELGLTAAMNKLGNIYRDGYYVKKDFFKAAYYFKKSAEAGDGEGMNGLGLLYDFGQGVAKDKKLAFQWFKRAAEAGSAIGMANVGYCYMCGDGTNKDNDKAEKWLKQSAEAGNYWGMMRYGEYFFRSERYEESIYWYKVAHDKNTGIDAGRAAYAISKVYRKVGEIKKSGGFWRKATRIFTGILLPRVDRVISLLDSTGKDDLKEADKWLMKSKQLGYNPDDSSCFITTAVCDSFSKPDDCYELTTFRNFRDNWLINQSDGKALIEEYYSTAPAIVKKINTLSNTSQIYETIWNEYLKPCLASIERSDFSECKKVYISMLNNLKNTYLKNK